MTLQCGGCKSLPFLIRSEDPSAFDEEFPYFDINFSSKSSEIPDFNFLRKEAYDELPDKINKLYAQVKSSLLSGVNILAGTGLRMLVESICLQQKITGRNLEEEIRKLYSNGIAAVETINGNFNIENKNRKKKIQQFEYKIKVAQRIIAMKTSTISPHQTALKSINEIDFKLNEVREIITGHCKNLKFDEIFKFRLSQNVPYLDSNSYNANGIYLFEIKNTEPTLSVHEWTLKFNGLWKNDAVTYYSAVRKMRVNSHNKFDEWVPIYLGRASHVGLRINEHIHSAADKRTFSMKLKARNNLYGEEFKVSLITLKIQNYNMIAPIIESTLRNKLNPICGRQ